MMKKYIKIILIIAVVILPGISSGRLYAHGQSHDRNAREAFFNAQMIEIKKRLNLDENKASQVEAVMRNYNNEINSARHSQFSWTRVHRDSLTDAMADKMIMDQFILGRKYLQIREKYYYELKKILSPKEILRIYRIEQEANKKVMEEFEKRKE